MTRLLGELTWPLRGTDDGSVRPEVLGLDGRIDNCDELFPLLKDLLRGNSSPDAVVGAVYERWGAPGLGRVVGDWSIVIRDRRRQRIVLASDFAGIRPLYYRQRRDGLHWASRLEALVGEIGVDAIDERYVAGFLMFGGCPHRTPYEGIRSVPPGHAVCVTSTELTIESFWKLPTTDVIRYADERRYDEQFLALFREAVTVRLQTTAPVMAELSGGLDSSSVVCVANQLIRSGAVPARTLTPISYVHKGSLDAPFIREVEAACGLEGIHLSTHQTPLASESDGSNPTPADWGPLERAAAVAARGVGARVFLTGQNGDLAMGNWFDDSLQVVASMRRGRLGQACSEALAWSKVLRIPVIWILARAARVATPLGRKPSLYSGDDMSATPQSAEESLLGGFLTRTGLDNPDGLFSTDWMQAPPERRKHFRALTMMREMRTLQAFGPMQEFDYTHPFAHRPLVEFVMSIPADVLCRPGEPRRLMRRVLAESWPPKLRARRSKSLLGAPLFEALRPLAVDLLAEREWQVVNRGWVDRASFSSRLERLKSGIDCNVAQLRQIVVLEHWLRSRIEHRPTDLALEAG